MQKSRGNIQLSSYDDIFGGAPDSSKEVTNEPGKEQVTDIALSELHPFKNHPFKVLDDEEMDKTVQSIREFGVLTPAIVCPRDEGGYEIVSGHRRCHASEIAGKETLPCIVRNLDDDAATILMVDANLQRETLLPSERAFALRMKLEAMKRQGERKDLTCGQVGHKLDDSKTREQIGRETGESGRQIQRYIRLTYLLPEFLEMVDNKQIGLNTAVEISYLYDHEQKMLLEAMDYSQSAPSLAQAQRIKKLFQEEGITQEAMNVIMSEEKKEDVDRVTLKHDTRTDFIVFPAATLNFLYCLTAK